MHNYRCKYHCTMTKPHSACYFTTKKKKRPYKQHSDTLTTPVEYPQVSYITFNGYIMGHKGELKQQAACSSTVHKCYGYTLFKGENYGIDTDQSNKGLSIGPMFSSLVLSFKKVKSLFSLHHFFSTC